MSEAVIVAVVSGLLTLIGTIITVVLSHRSTISTLEKNSEVADQAIKGEISVIKTEISALSARVEKHNNVIERTYALEQKAAVLDEKIKVANNRIRDLEGGSPDA